MHCFSRDLSISGIFLNTEALLRIGGDVQIDLEVHPEEWLALNGEVARRIEFGDREHASGFAVKFGELSDRSHETLLRYFLTDKVVAFYQIFLQRFPHLRDELSEQDAALIVNLWEDNRHALVEEHHNNAPITSPPRIFELPSGRGNAKPIARAILPKPMAAAVAKPSPLAKPIAVSKPTAKPVEFAKPIALPVKLAAPVTKAPITKAPIAKPPITKPPIAKAAPTPAKIAAPAAKMPPKTATPVTVKKRAKAR